ncbi:KLTH0A03300p [Lachancea thermotolerans CBS 6340]|uniref:KLTH0A03300p n=1 Tax=Lachancea thermotolerans (strain ATCC 56472 / CBS 6340 / NRRL Y-8284) TaxID=559295 RepID=C5DBK2_LACTC|nr:KLTH0A03300p [Lachancea thermotolerans CBS 6340]CAR21159.1 KLTH0A03300p [Lachancea thermotolerans CBS 6340]
MAESDGQMQQFQRYLSKARKILCIVGSGVSASSGIATYQLQKGSWHGYTALDLATPEAFQNDPGLVWLFYSNRRYEALRAKPNEGHYALAELCRRYPSGISRRGDSASGQHPPASVNDKKKVLVVSQNVDGLHQRAGHPPESLVELHGSVFGLRCTQFFCNYRSRNSNDRFLTPALYRYTPRNRGANKKRTKRVSLHDGTETKKRRLDSTANGVQGQETDLEPPSSEEESERPEMFPTLEPGDLPSCPQCHQGILRPAVVWYGESLPLDQMDEVDQFFNKGGPVDLVLVIGTSGKVWPAMGYVERAKKSGSRVAIFNRVIEDLDQVRDSKDIWGFQGDAAQLLPKALKPLIGERYKPRDWRRR